MGRDRKTIRKKGKALMGRAVLFLVVAGILFLGCARFLFVSICGRKEVPWPDLGAADEVQYGILTEGYEIRKEGGEEVSILASDKTRLVAHYYERQQGAPVVLFFHGYRSFAVVDGVPAYRITKQLNWNLLLVTSRAHGESSGDFVTFGAREREDCLAWANWAEERFGEEVPLFLMGVSMGGAQVVQSCDLALPASVCGIINDCGYVSFMDMLGRSIQLRTGKGFLVKLPKLCLEAGARIFGGFSFSDKAVYKSVENTKIPILFIHSDTDQVVPFSAAETLYEKYAGPKEMLKIHGAGHGENYRTEPERYEKAVKAFLTKYGKEDSKTK